MRRIDESARDCGAPLKTILCLADGPELDARIAVRLNRLSQPGGPAPCWGDGAARFPHLPLDTLMLNVTDPPALTAQVAHRYVVAREV